MSRRQLVPRFTAFKSNVAPAGGSVEPLCPTSLDSAEILIQRKRKEKTADVDAGIDDQQLRCSSRPDIETHSFMRMKNAPPPTSRSARSQLTEHGNVG